MFFKLTNADNDTYVNLSNANTIKIEFVCHEYDKGRIFDIIAIYDKGKVILQKELNIEQATTILENIMEAFEKGTIIYKL